MIKNQEKAYQTILMISAVLTVVLAFMNVISVASTDVGMFLRIGAGFTIPALLAAFYYIFKGYTKEQAWAYKVFCIGYVCFLLLSLIHSATVSSNPVSIVAAALMLALVLVLTVIKNLKKRVSFILAGSAVAVSLAKLVESCIRHPIDPSFADSVGMALFIRYGSQLFMALLLGLMVFAKYVDKDSRHTD